MEYGGSLFDPSYGLEYGVKSGALDEFIRQSVESVGTVRPKNPGEQTWGYGEVYVVTAPGIDKTLFSWSP